MEDSTTKNKNFCQCGCGSEIPFITVQNKPQRFRKGHSLFNSGRFQKGHKLSKEHAQKLIRLGENNNKWKGDRAGYFGVHMWVRRHFPPPDRCEFCHQKKKLQLANITGVYNREFRNYRYICVKCHMGYDDQQRKAWATKKKLMDKSTI